ASAIRVSDRRAQSVGPTDALSKRPDPPLVPGLCLGLRWAAPPNGSERRCRASPVRLAERFRRLRGGGEAAGRLPEPSAGGRPIGWASFTWVTLTRRGGEVAPKTRPRVCLR